VLSLEGVSHTLLVKLAQSGAMPNLVAILAQGDLARMNSVLPAVSSVAWAGFATGMNPGKHGIFGLVDREPNPFSAFYPNSRDLKAPTLWEHLGRAGRKLGVMNVPVTYPPKQINGFMVGCFLSPDLAKATYPVDLAPRLMEMDYRVEPDMGQFEGDLAGVMTEVGETVARRFSSAFALMKSEPWDYFHLHESCTDRVGHMLLAGWEDGDQDLAPEFEGFWRKLDSYLGELRQELPPGARLLMMSEAGLMRTKAQVFINHWLEKNGYLHFLRGGRELMNMHPDSRAYSLEPGRIYINREGREQRGRVQKGKPYDELRDELIHRLSGLMHPETGEPLTRKVFKREELYAGAQLGRAADIVIDPVPGFELKYNLDAPKLLAPQPGGATHCYEDAFLFLQNIKRLPDDNTFSILDLSPTIMTLMGLALPQGMDGQSLV
jgi:predicted AlkP superfamily phosphohydrolase/phosphomutase